MEEELKISGKIKTEKDLEKIIQYLRNQGFSPRDSEYELHNRKIENIFNSANKLAIKHDSKELEKLKRIKNYDEAEKIANNYFSTFNVDDKIYEYLNTFYIEPDASIQTPSQVYPETNSIIEWFEFKSKYNLKDVFDGSRRVEYINLDKAFIKFNFSKQRIRDFQELYTLIFNEKTNNFNFDAAGWQDLGKIEIKTFAKGTAQIKGDLDKIKEYYYNYILSHKYNATIIVYKGKREIFKSKGEF